MKENCIYAEKAANWWVEKIRNSTTEIVHGIDCFQNLLENKIRETVSTKGCLHICTYHCRSKLLDEIAETSYLSVDIPAGFEMRIFFDNVYIYNSSGIIISSF